MSGESGSAYRGEGYVILARNTHNGAVFVMTEPAAECAAIWPTEEAAEEAARHIPILQAWPYTIVEAP